MDGAFARRSAALALALAVAGCRSTPQTGVEEKFNLWPLAYYETRTNPEGHELQFLWPLGSNWRAGDEHGSRVLPFWWDETCADGSRKTDVLLLYWQQHSGDGSAWTHVLFPFFWLTRSPDMDRTAFWPLFGRTTHKDTGRGSGFALWPLANWDSNEKTGAGTFGFVDMPGLVSLFGRSHEFREEAQPASAPADATEEAAAEPKTHTIEERDTHFLSVLHPRVALFSKRSTRDSETGAEETHSHFFPLVWFSRGDGESFSMTLPFHLGWENDDGSSRDFWVPPLFGREHDPKDDRVGTDVLWPLVRSETWRESGGPAWHFRFLPFAWFTKRPDSDVSLFLPLWYRLRDPDNEYVHFVPFWGRHSEDHGRREKTFVVPPLFIRTTDKDGHLSRNEYLWPLSSFETKEGSETSRVFPLWYWNRGGHTAHLNVLGLFDRAESEVSARWLLWPLYSSVNKEGVGRRSAWLPVFDVLRIGDPPGQDEESTSFLWPISSFERRGEHTARWIFPVLWWFDDGVNHSNHHVWPLFGVDEEGGLGRVSTLWPFFWFGKTADGARGDWHFLWPLGGAEWNEQESKSRFFPLWIHESYPKTGHSESWYLWPLVNVRSDNDGLAEWSFLWEVLRWERTPKTEDFHLLYALYRSHEETGRSSWSVPLFAGYENVQGAKTLRLLQFIPIRWGEKPAE